MNPEVEITVGDTHYLVLGLICAYTSSGSTSNSSQSVVLFDETWSHEARMTLLYSTAVDQTTASKNLSYEHTSGSPRKLKVKWANPEGLDIYAYLCLIALVRNFS